MSPEAVKLPIPQFFGIPERQLLKQFVTGVPIEAVELTSITTACRAALALLRDLIAQGWDVEWAAGSIIVSPPQSGDDVEQEKKRVRIQEQLKRDEQLRTPSVRRFIEGMERPRERDGRFRSIFDLMRDGIELSEKLKTANSGQLAFSDIVDPYLQVFDSSERCEWTGLRLMDVWRYFRHTWSNQYVSTPGRSMPVLVRDRAADNHPVIGIAALGSAIVQLAHRDRALGWNPPDVLDQLRQDPTSIDSKWLLDRLDAWRSELYTVDLAADGLWSDEWWDAPDLADIDALVRESALRRQRHQRLGRKSDFRTSKAGCGDEFWLARAQTDLFRSKRCKLAADLLTARRVLEPCTGNASEGTLAAVLSTAAGRRSVSWTIRRAKAETVGTEIADITVCGAIAPYTHLLGGKLVASLLASPSVVRAYHDKYREKPSEIASAIAARRVVRSANLIYLGTTSLYGAGSSQYNRLKIPSDVLDSSADLEFAPLGRSQSFGTSHLSQETVSALADLAEQAQRGARVKSIFGEGASPKFRKIREGMDLLGWPSDELLRHRRERIIYGVELAAAPGDYLLRRQSRPDYLFDPSLEDDVARVSDWWRTRWMVPRSQREGIVDAVSKHTLQRPVKHGARVALPDDSPSEGVLFGSHDEEF